MHRWSALAVGLAALAGAAALARADDAASEWSSANNTPAVRWNYGYKAAPTAALVRHNALLVDGLLLESWRQNPNVNGSYAIFNPTAVPKSPSPGVTLPGRSLALQPGSGGAWSAVRWTAVAAGTYAVRATFMARSNSATECEVVVAHGGEVLFSRWLQPPISGGVASMSARIACAAGDSIDFMVGPGLVTEMTDIMGLDATVNWEPTSNTDGPVLAFGPYRFAVCRWSKTLLDQIAFDPLNRRIPGAQGIRDLCGAIVVPNAIGEGQGLAWDPITHTYWQVTADRTVRRYSADGVLVDTLFTVPQFFVVPGSGLDTLESVRGVAVDSTHVYFVDAGPDPGTPASNAWFKFTRGGAPVRASRSTDLVARLSADEEALVDDIVWSPATSRVYPGRLLVALEHTGIQVLDVEGNTVDEFRWAAQELPPRTALDWYGRPAAFAGLALDPVTGNLYLQDNTDADAQVWVRLEGPGTASLAVSLMGPDGVLQYPQAGCNLRLWETPASGGGAFGAAYRPANQMVYSMEFGSGTLWRSDPRTGKGWRVGETGVADAWGLAYAADRDLLYGVSTYPASRIITVDPHTGVASLTPQIAGFDLTDIAFCPADGYLYGVNGSPQARLIRIDRDTGVGSIVGNTASVRGIDWDDASGRLWGAGLTGPLWSIDPASGAADTIITLPGGGFDGLAVVNVPVPQAPVSVEWNAPDSRALELSAWPNPARSGVRLRFALAVPQDAAVRVFDAQGRVVRDVFRGRLAAGAHTFAWDGADGDGRAQASGIYFARVEYGSEARVARVVRIR